MTGTGEQNRPGRLPEGVPSGPTSPVAPGRHSAGTGLGEQAPVPGTPHEVLIRRVYRTGVQTIERDGERYFLTIKNRSYRSVVEVPIETARRYYRAMR